MEILTLKEVEEALEDCVSALASGNSPFTRFEREWIQNVYDEFYRKSRISIKQRHFLKQLWEKV